LRRGSVKKSGGQESQALGRSRGGFSTKIHASVDALGNPLRFLLTGGQRHDITQADDLIADLDFERVIADRSYDAEEFLNQIVEKEAEAVIPPRKNRKEPREYDLHLYKERHLIECFFNKIKHYRRLFSRFEKLDQRLLGFLSFAGALIWLR
jgi:transposase